VRELWVTVPAAGSPRNYAHSLPLDPIVSLSVALAEAPGTCAFFLGSGVSRDAGVPTGGEIMQDGLRRLYRLESKTTGDIDDDALHTWLEEMGRREIT
jgi:hypothetical protein